MSSKKWKEVRRNCYESVFCVILIDAESGYLTLKSIKLGAFIVGGSLGYILSILIYYICFIVLFIVIYFNKSR